MLRLKLIHVSLKGHVLKSWIFKETLKKDPFNVVVITVHADGLACFDAGISVGTGMTELRFFYMVASFDKLIFLWQIGHINHPVIKSP